MTATLSRPQCYAHDMLYFADINECDSQPCLNGATCNNTQPANTYFCHCVAGYDGIVCETGQWRKMNTMLSNHRQSNYLINSFLKLTKTATLGMNPPLTGGFPPRQ